MASEWATKAITEYPNLFQKRNCDHRHVLISAKFSTETFSKRDNAPQTSRLVTARIKTDSFQLRTVGGAGLLVFLVELAELRGAKSVTGSRSVFYFTTTTSDQYSEMKSVFIVSPPGPLQLLSLSYSCMSTILRHDKWNSKKRKEVFFQLFWKSMIVLPGS